ncbi:MAG: rhodanese-like domain-containing protein [Proteobacteria bacterium]|nr:rhodanese-like domain-containing protein [Pseudomonadota bacterium]
MVYAGDVTPDEAWQILDDDPRAVLIDVRTDAEWAYVGGPDLSPLGKSIIRISWQEFPGMEINPHFSEQLAAAGVEKDQALLFICRSGARSKSAALTMTDAGFESCHNVAEGFEGDRDEHGRRGLVNGWKKRGLPWGQS